MSLNPFPVTYSRPEVELMHLLIMRRHYCHKRRRKRCRALEITVYRKMASLNSNNMTLDFKREFVVWSKLRVRNDNWPKYKTRHRTTKIYTSC